MTSISDPSSILEEDNVKGILEPAEIGHLKVHLVHHLGRDLIYDLRSPEDKRLLEGSNLLRPGEIISAQECKEIAEASTDDLLRDVMDLFGPLHKAYSSRQPPGSFLEGREVFAGIFRDCFAAIVTKITDGGSLSDQERKETLRSTGVAFLYWLAAQPPYPEFAADVGDFLGKVTGETPEFHWQLEAIDAATSEDSGSGQTGSRGNIPELSGHPASPETASYFGATTVDARVRRKRVSTGVHD